MDKQEILALANRERPPSWIDPAERASSLAALLLKRYPIDERPTVQWLVERFPIAFAPESERIRPLKIGVHLDILAIAATEAEWLDSNILSHVLRRWVSAPAYRFAIGQGKRRRDLQGMRCATITPAERGSCRPAVKRLKRISDEELTQRIEELRNTLIETQDDRKRSAVVVDEVREILRSLPNEHPASDELTGQLLRLIDARRRVLHRLHGDLYTIARQVLSPERFVQVDVVARSHGDNDAAAALSNEFEQILRALDANELVLMRARRSSVERRRIVQERQTLEQERSRVSALIEATPSVATAFVKAASTMVPADEYKRVRI